MQPLHEQPPDEQRQPAIPAAAAAAPLLPPPQALVQQLLPLAQPADEVPAAPVALAVPAPAPHKPAAVLESFICPITQVLGVVGVLAGCLAALPTSICMHGATAWACRDPGSSSMRSWACHSLSVPADRHTRSSHLLICSLFAPRPPYWPKQEPMREPVVAPDGHTYERSAILAWIERQVAAGRPPRSPFTNEPLPTPCGLVPNHVVRSAMQELLGAAEAATSTR